MAGWLAMTVASLACQNQAASEPPPGAARPAYVVSDASHEATRLMFSGKADDAAALMNAYVAANPRSADGHFTLALAHEKIASAMRLNGDTASPARLSHLEKAADHYWMYLGLVRKIDDPSYQAAGLRALAGIYGKDGLHQLAEAEKVARRLVDEDSRSAESYRVLAQTLRESDRQDEATAVLRKARMALPSSEQRRLVGAMAEHARQSPTLPKTDLKALVDEMMTIGDGWVATEPLQPTGPLAKQLALELQADRLEQNPARKRELLAEAELWRKAGDTQLDAERRDVMTKLQEVRKRRPDAHTP
jgi:tetratricopeptide (TPR) repeat protein